MIIEQLNNEQLKTKAAELMQKIESKKFEIEYKKKLMIKDHERYNIYNFQIETAIKEIANANQMLMEVELELNRQQVLKNVI